MNPKQKNLGGNFGDLNLDTGKKASRQHAVSTLLAEEYTLTLYRLSAYRNYFIILLTSLLVTSCSLKQKIKVSPIANWSTCSKDGMYIEMYLSDTTLTFQQTKGLHQSYLYQLKEDMLIYNTVDTDYQEPTVAVKLRITVITDSSMILESVNPYEKWEFIKIKEKVKLPTLTEYDLQSLSKYEEEKRHFFARGSKFKCVDKRSPAEITHNSLDQNSFKF